jgi:O-antigen ligase
VWPGVEIGGFAATEALQLSIAAVGLLIWALCTTWSTSLPVRTFLAAVFALWAVVMVNSIFRGPIPNLSALVVGVVLVMLILKPLGPHSARRTSDVLGWTLVAVFLASIALQSLGVVGGWYDSFGNKDLLAFDEANYWLPLSDALGIDGRWAGPFTHPNRVGPLAGFLVVYGATRRWPTRIVFVVVGLLALILASSRTSYVGTAAGLAALVSAWWLVRPGRIPRPWRVTVILAALAGFVALWFLPNQGLSGRTGIWPIFIQMWLEHPWLGTGSKAVGEAIGSGRLPTWGWHAHNTVIDVTTRYGVVALSLVLLIYGASVAITFRAALRGRPEGIGLVVLIVVAGLGHTVIGFRYQEVTLSILLLAVMMGAQESTRKDDENA